jgi:transcriptional regulator with XRE-family HTH domain
MSRSADNLPGNTADAPPPAAIHPDPPPNRSRSRSRAKAQAREIGQRIRALRQQRNLTQARLVARLGHGHEKWLSRIENGHQLITLSTLGEIAEVLDVPLDALLQANPALRDPKAVGARLRAARQQQGWTQAQAIERLGYSTATWLSGIETGRRQLRPASLEKLARLYQRSVADLLDDEPLPAPTPPATSAPPDQA